MNIDHVQKLSTRQKQKIKVLTSKPGFTSTISELRVKWNIPDNGINSQQELDSWYKKLEENTQNYFTQKWHEERETLLKIKEQGNHPKYNELLKKFNDSVPRNAFLRDITKLTKAQKLSPRWVSGIKHYLLTNDPDKMGMFIGPIITTNLDLEFDTQTVSIEIDADSTLSDIKAVWPSVKLAQNNLRYKTQDKFQPLRKFDRNKKAYELHKQDKKYEEIAKELSNNEEEYGYEDIGKMIERYKKKVDIN